MYVQGDVDGSFSLLQHAWEGVVRRRLQTSPIGRDPNKHYDDDNPDMTDYTPLVLLVLFLMAFVMAAGVEETMKHFAVRCCRFPRALRDPHSVLVYLVASALGFATFENIGYVFGAAAVDDDIDTDDEVYYSAEVVTLIARVLLPVHFICAVLQATELSKVAMSYEAIPLFWVLFPAIMLHGCFDFVLFVGGAFGVLYSLNSALYQGLFLAVPFCISFFGAYLAYKRFSNIQHLYEAGWQAFHNDVTGLSIGDGEVFSANTDELEP